MRLIAFTLSLAIGCAPLFAAGEKEKNAERLDEASCIVLVPGLKKAAFVVGGKYGRGFALCRAQGGTGWGPPAAIRIEGGSGGFQLGVSSTDVILLVMNERGMKR